MAEWQGSAGRSDLQHRISRPITGALLRHFETCWLVTTCGIQLRKLSLLPSASLSGLPAHPQQAVWQFRVCDQAEVKGAVLLVQAVQRTA